MLEKAIDTLGGLKPLLGKGKKALLKGNLVFAQPFPITTDPQIALLIGRHLKDSGFEQVNVFDAPGTYLNDSKEKTLDMHKLKEQKNPYGIGFYTGDAGERSEFIMTKNQQWQAYPEIGIHNDIYLTPVNYKYAVPQTASYILSDLRLKE